jgi:mannonate dehydratase
MSISRRALLKSIGGAGLLGLSPSFVRAQEQVARATRGMSIPRIRDINVIECAPGG